MQFIKELPDDVLLWASINNPVEPDNRFSHLGYVVVDESDEIISSLSYCYEGKVYHPFFYSFLANRITYRKYSNADEYGSYLLPDDIVDQRVLRRLRLSNQNLFVKTSMGSDYVLTLTYPYRVDIVDNFATFATTIWRSIYGTGLNTVAKNIDKIEKIITCRTASGVDIDFRKPTNGF